LWIESLAWLTQGSNLAILHSSSQLLAQNKEGALLTMMPGQTRGTPQQGVLSQVADPEKMKEDKEKVREYIKEELFERVVFFGAKHSLNQAECCTVTT
jgi:hypothetical protein